MKYSIKEIINSQNYKKVESKFLVKYFFIPLAWPITWIFVNLGITANQVTFFRIPILIIVFFLIIFNYLVLGYCLFYFSFILDCVDGQICRVADKASVFGKFFDGWVDTVYDLSFSLIIALSIDSNTDSIMAIAILASLFNALLWIILLRYSLYEKKHKKYKFRKFEKKFFSFVEKKLLVQWFDIKYFIFPFFLLFNYQKTFIYILLLINIILLIIYTLQKIYIAYCTLNFHRKSSSSN